MKQQKTYEDLNTSIKLNHIQMFLDQTEDGKRRFAHVVLDNHMALLQ